MSTTTECRHQEYVDGYTGTCKNCGQVREYDPEAKKPPRIVKEGVVPANPAPQEVNAFDDSLLTEVEPTVQEEKRRPGRPPGSPTKRSVLKQREKDKEAIIADYYALKLMAFFKKWHLSSSNWGKLKILWKVEGKSKAQISGGTTLPHPVVGITPKDKETLISLPPFPEWNEDWLTEVKLEWFKAYLQLVELWGRIKPYGSQA